ncbi:MAG: tight adherence protein [Solirubrobacteraceae bacterium]|nr:tight adherence protein [Solirubrobacteraceae bacterium]
MTLAVVLAAAAGASAAAGLVDVATAPRRRGARRRGERAVRALAAFGRRVGAPLPSRDLDARLDAAGRPLGLEPADVTALKGGVAVVTLIAGAPMAGALPGRLPLLAALALPVAGFLAPDALLARRAARRGRAMEAELPDLLDLLRVSVEAGLPTARALGEVGRRHTGLLAREWRRAADELALGVPRDEALHRLARRCPPPALATLTAALRRAERHGAPLSGTLAAQAGEARAARARRIREHAAKAAPKIQLVVALLLVPSVLLLVAAALVASFVR